MCTFTQPLSSSNFSSASLSVPQPHGLLFLLLWITQVLLLLPTHGCGAILCSAGSLPGATAVWFFVLKNRLSCSPRWPPAQCMTEDNLGPLCFLPLPSKCSQTSPCQLTRVLLQLERTGPPAKSERCWRLCSPGLTVLWRHLQSLVAQGTPPIGSTLPVDKLRSGSLKPLPFFEAIGWPGEHNTSTELSLM